MKKLLVAGLSTLLLAGCGTEEVTEKKVGNVESTEKAASVEEESQKKTDVIDVNKEVADTANIKATFVSVEKVIDKEWDEEYIDVKFEVENKTDKTIVIQAEEVSSDGKMIDESILNMSQDVAGGKKADAVLRIENYDGDLPAVEKDLEMLMLVIDDESYETIETHKVNVDFK
ncbi:hypothetical protein AS888_20830 [Peribacillus simplex]|uniref:Lipoprotein n=1 Tax=Peribacillus simplex TaxID=1478 RepID=A0A120GPE2_9BACI|nr:hypothetical protein [Peribacillus simplex]KWW17959.1 hypothetical protein AS888_20830 [Peribacillus simplex]